MAVRAVLTVCAAIGFFQAFRLLPFADVFVFIALMPLIAAALSGPVLGERVRPATWTALLLGAGGVLCLMPAARPFVWTPMPLADLGWVAGYAVFLFAARWL